MVKTLIYLLIAILDLQATPLLPIQVLGTLEQDRPLQLKTELVEIRVVVSDKNGEIVDHLEKGDFEILENDRVQQLSFFSVENLKAERSKHGRALKAEVNRSRVTATSLTKRVILLVLDTFHLSDGNVLRSKQAIRKFIDEQMTDTDLVAVIPSGGPLGLVNQFTSDKRILLNAVQRLRAWGVRNSRFTPYLAYLVTNDPSPADTRGPTSAAIEILRAEEPSIDAQNAQTIQRDVQLRARAILSEAAALRGSSLRTLEAAMDQMSKIPGQRIAFFISDGFSLKDNAGNAHGELNRTTSRAVRSGILVYSLDAKGLNTDVLINDASSRVVMTPAVQSYTSDSEKEEQDALNAIAKDTGGDAFFNNNDMVFSIKKALDANSVYYALAYYPSTDKNDRAYRRLTVRVKNHPEYTVRTQKGYLPPDPKLERELKRQTPQQAVMKAILAPLPQTGIGVTATACYLERVSDNSQVTLEAFIDGNTLDYGSGEDHHALDCEVTIVVFDKTGNSIKIITDRVQGSLTAERLAEGRKNGYRYLKRLELKPGIYQARIAVRENGNARIGTANAWVEVPDLNRSKLALSSIVLTRVEQAVENAGTRRGEALKLLLPGVRQGIPYFKQSTSLAYQLTVYESSSRKAEESALLIQSEVLDGGESIWRSQWLPAAGRLIRAGKRGFDAGGQINLDLKPGIYELRITVKDSKSKRSAHQTVIFEVED